MGCRCQERRVQIEAAVRSIGHGDLAGAAQQLLDANRTLAEDAGALLRHSGQRLAAAHARLKR